MEKVTVYKVHLRLDGDGFNHRTEALLCDDAPKTYLYKHGKVVYSKISKSDIMAVKEHYTPHHIALVYTCYCLEGQQAEAMAMLKERIVAEATKIKNSIERLMSHIKQ